ncbi:MAG: hypothetical protein IKX37_03470 [Bacteroidales bacterium]|nr:hypothetical protein [Bacteroidales bacterium]
MKILHHILRGSTLATALFIFQACYGMPPSYERGGLYEATIKVTDSKGAPLQGVKLYARNSDMSDFIADPVISDEEGVLHFEMTFPMENPEIAMRFEAEGYVAKDTTIKDVLNPEPDFTVKLKPQK